MQEQEQQERNVNEEAATPSEQCRSSNDETDLKSKEIAENEKNAECREEDKDRPCDEVVNNNGNTGKTCAITVANELQSYKRVAGV